MSLGLQGSLRYTINTYINSHLKRAIQKQFDFRLLYQELYQDSRGKSFLWVRKRKKKIIGSQKILTTDSLYLGSQNSKSGFHRKAESSLCN